MTNCVQLKSKIGSIIFQILRSRVKKYAPICFSESERRYFFIPAVKAISQTFNASAASQISKPYGH